MSEREFYRTREILHNGKKYAIVIVDDLTSDKGNYRVIFPKEISDLLPANVNRDGEPYHFLDAAKIFADSLITRIENTHISKK